jgi:transposase InsO family protein
VRRIVCLRWRHRLSPLAIASKLFMPASTVHAVLVRCRLNRLTHIDIRTGDPIRRYEHDHPGSLIHVDVKKLGNIPTGGGWRFVGRSQGKKNRAATSAVNRSPHRDVSLGHAFVHTVIDDHSRVAYAEIHDDETAETAIGVLRRAVGWFAMRGVTVERVLSDNGSCYKSHAWRSHRRPACRSRGPRDAGALGISMVLSSRLGDECRWCCGVDTFVAQERPQHVDASAGQGDDSMGVGASVCSLLEVVVAVGSVAHHAGLRGQIEHVS